MSSSRLPSVPAKKAREVHRKVCFFCFFVYIGRESNPERAKSVKKVACGKFFSFLVRSRVPKCLGIWVASNQDAQQPSPLGSTKKRKEVHLKLCLFSLFCVFFDKTIEFFIFSLYTESCMRGVL